MTEGLGAYIIPSKTFCRGTVKNMEFLKKIEIIFCFNGVFSTVSKIRNLIKPVRFTIKNGG
jgi:hypothetical protein